jgi:hypothetical protein
MIHLTYGWQIYITVTLPIQSYLSLKVSYATFSAEYIIVAIQENELKVQ